MIVRSKYAGRVLPGLTLLFFTLAALTASSSAIAQRDRGAGPAHPRGDVVRSGDPGRHAWRGGPRTHARHDARLSWSIGIGGPWYPYPYAYPYTYPYAPVYPYSYPWAPPVAATPPPVVAPAPYWYFCEASRTYYPYVQTCPGGWQAVPATPSNASPVPQQ